MKKKLNIVFMGTPDFAVPALDILTQFHNVIAVYTKEPKPVGRKMILTKSPIHQLSEQKNIPVYTPKNFKQEDTIATLKNLNPDMIIVAAYGIILPQSVLDIPPLGCINIHASILPNLRGANPIQRAILNGDKTTGITIMKMDAGMDTGDILLPHETEIDENITYGELENKLSEIGKNLIIEYLDKRENLTPKKQPNNFTIAPKLNKEESKINWEKNANEIHNLIRGLSPYPIANFTHNENIIKVIKSEIIKEKNTSPIGTILNKNMDIACGNNTILRILEVQKIGGKPMKIKDFLNGYKLEIGEQLH
jgi:methionyl-tRNA formyltransferase